MDANNWKEKQPHLAWQDDEDTVLAERSRQGDRQAFARLVERYQRQIYCYAYRILGNGADAEDLTQDVFLAAFRGIRRFRGDCRFSTWLFRIAVNQTRNRVKYLARRLSRSWRPSWPDHHEQDLATALEDMAPSPEQATINRETAAAVQQCLMQLPEASRQIIVLRDVHGLSYTELSEILGCSMGTIKSRLHRARAALQQLYAANTERRE